MEEIKKSRHSFQTDDPRLTPIAEKCLLQSVSTSTMVSHSIVRRIFLRLAGWPIGCGKMHGDIAYFNVNRHINPTNVCVAACRLCAFGRKKDAPGAYTMALEEAWQRAAEGYSEAVTEFHLVGGLHPDLHLEYFLDLISGLKQRFPKVQSRPSPWWRLPTWRSARS